MNWPILMGGQFMPDVANLWVEAAQSFLGKEVLSTFVSRILSGIKPKTPMVLMSYTLTGDTEPVPKIKVKHYKGTITVRIV